MEKIPFIVLSAFIVYLYITWYFRINCYYIQYILEQNGKGFCKKFISGIKILFCCHNVPTPNFIDYKYKYNKSYCKNKKFLNEYLNDKSKKQSKIKGWSFIANDEI